MERATMMVAGLCVALAGCVGEPAELVPVECDGDVVVCDGESICEGDHDAYVVCGRAGPYCRARGTYVDEPVELTPVCDR